MMRGSDETVVRIVGGIECTHPVEFAEHHGCQQMVDGKRIVRMPIEDLLELLHGPVVVHVVEAIEGTRVERIGGAIGDAFGWVRRRGGLVGEGAYSEHSRHSDCDRTPAEPDGLRTLVWKCHPFPSV